MIWVYGRNYSVNVRRACDRGTRIPSSVATGKRQGRKRPGREIEVTEVRRDGGVRKRGEGVGEMWKFACCWQGWAGRAKKKNGRYQIQFHVGRSLYPRPLPAHLISTTSIQPGFSCRSLSLSTAAGQRPTDPYYEGLWSNVSADKPGQHWL